MPCDWLKSQQEHSKTHQENLGKAPVKEGNRSPDCALALEVAKVDLPKVKATALTDIKDPIEITVKLDGEVYIGESKVEVENLIPRLNAITEQNTEARIYIRGDRVVAYGRIMEIMSIINSAGYIKVALITQNLEQ